MYIVSHCRFQEQNILKHIKKKQEEIPHISRRQKVCIPFRSVVDIHFGSKSNKFGILSRPCAAKACLTLPII